MKGEIIDKLKVETFNFLSRSVSERERFCGVDFINSVSEKYINMSQNVKSIVPLITCGRVEFIYIADDFLNLDGFEKISGWDALRHLVEVASGIKTLIIGETQIVGQMKTAFFQARKSGLCGGEMMGILSEILRISKIVRNACGIEVRTFSSFVRSKAEEIFGDISGLTIFVAGTGKIAHDVFKVSKHFKKLVIYSHNKDRAVERAKSISELLGIDVSYVWSIYDGLEMSDVAVLATRHPGFLVKKEHIQNLLEEHPAKKLLLVDFAVPRNISPDIKGLSPSIYLFDIDDVADRRFNDEKIRQARKLIDEELDKLKRKIDANRKVLHISNMREEFQNIIYSHLRKYTNLTDEEIEKISSSLSQKLLSKFFEEYKSATDYESMKTEVLMRKEKASN